MKVILTREQSGFEPNNVRTVRNERCRIVFRLSKCFSGEKKNLTGTLHIFGFFLGGCETPSLRAALRPLLRDDADIFEYSS